MRTFSFILFLAFLVLGRTAWAQPVCPQEFSEMAVRCISASQDKFANKPLPLSSITPDSILFYKTAVGEYGKIKVLSVVNSSSKEKECAISFEAVTYGNGTVFVPNSSLSIRPGKNHWLNDKIYLNREGSAALILEKISPQERFANQLRLLEKEGKVDELKELQDRLARKSQDELTSDSKAACFIEVSSGSGITIYKKGSTEEKGFKQENNALFLAPLVLIFVAIFLIVRVFMEDQDKYKTQEVLEDAETQKVVKQQALFIRVTKPFYKRYFLPIVQASKNKQAMRTKYRQKLANAGLMKEMSPEEFVALKFFMIIGAPFAFLAVRWIMSETWPLYITPLMGIVGFFYPNIWLEGMIKKRADDVLRAMPFIVDMLALSVEAGLDFMAAIQRVIEKAPMSPLVEEFETLIKETKIGSSRAEGLRQLGWRVNVIEINSFCATLIAADSVGASIAPLLKQLSSELRVKRSSRAEQQGATAATKILIPMIFFILPAVLVAIFAPMLLKMMSGKL